MFAAFKRILKHLTWRRASLTFIILLFLFSGIWFGWSNLQPNEQAACQTDAQAAAARGLTLDIVQKLQTQRGITNPEICLMPDAKLERAILKADNPKPDHPAEAVAFRLEQTRDENGFIPPDGLKKAREHMRLMQTSESATNATLSWTWLGPGNIGGRVRSIVIHPSNPAIMWGGSVSGGIWKSTDSGASWQPEDDFMANLAVSTLVMDPSNPDVIYAGTGEGFYNADSIRGAGVFKTTNGGTTWTQLASTANSSWYYVNQLAISNDGQTLLAATGNGIYRSIDAGSSWTQVNTDTYVKDVDFNPANNNLAVASGSYGRAYYSIDGGATWNPTANLPALGWLGRVELTYAPSAPSTVYASVSQNSGEIWKSSDGGQSYTLVTSAYSFLGSQGWYDNVLWVDPTNPNTLIVGGIDLWRSTNGGSTLTKMSQWWSAPSSAHADHHFIVQHPNFDGSSNKIVYFGNDGGIYKTDNVYTAVGTSGWQELNNNLGITQFYGAAGNTTSGVIVGGTQDNGTLRYTGGTESWDAMFGGDGGWSAADPTDPNYFYGEYVFLQIHRSTNGGASSSYIDGGLGDAGGCANFIAPFILDPNNPNTMLAGGCSLWRSSNVKAFTPSWTNIKSSVGSNISAVAAAIGNSDVIWIGHNNGSVYKTTNGTSASPNWTQVDTNSPNLPNRWVHRVTIDPNNPIPSPN